MNDRAIIEDCIIPALLTHIMIVHMEGYASNTRLEPEARNTFETSIETLNKFVKTKIEYKPQLNRRLMRITKLISNHFVDNGFTTLKSLLTLTAWNNALMDAGGLIIEDEEYYGLLSEFARIIEKGYSEIESFEKQDSSAIKHVTKIHKIAQDNGYFL